MRETIWETNRSMYLVNVRVFCLLRVSQMSEGRKYISTISDVERALFTQVHSEQALNDIGRSHRPLKVTETRVVRARNVSCVKRTCKRIKSNSSSRVAVKGFSNVENCSCANVSEQLNIYRQVVGVVFPGCRPLMWSSEQQSLNSSLFVACVRLVYTSQ